MIPFPINYEFVLLAAVINMVLGFLWYSPVLFGKPWSQLMGFTDKSLKAAQAKVGPLYGITFISAIVTSYVLAIMINYTAASTFTQGMRTGFWLWAGFVFPVQFSGALFDTRAFSPKLLAINTGYQLTSLLINGALLARWV